MARKSIAENVKALMTEHGHLNIKKFAKDVNLPYTTIHSLLSGAQPTIKTLQAISKFFGVSLDRLVEGEDLNQVALESLLSEEIFNGFLKVRIERIITKGKPS